MKKQILNDLRKARELSRQKKYTESIEIFKRHFNEHPECMNPAHRDEYALAVYNEHVKNFRDENELLDAAEFITEITSQKDTTNDAYCIYTITVFAVFRYLNSRHEYHRFLHWLEKINPDLLGEHRYRKNGRLYSSRKESYYEYLSKAYLDSGEYEKCIEVSKKALAEITTFTNFADTWHRWRMTKSFRNLNMFEEALECLSEVLEVKQEWYMYRMGAEIHYTLNNPFKALDYLCPAILSKKFPNTKASLYYLSYRVLKGFNPEMALPHAQLYYLIKTDNGEFVESEIEDLNIDKSQLDKKELLNWINDTWTQYKYKNQKLIHGTVTGFSNEKNYGFIKTMDDESVFFHKSDFMGDDIYIGQRVSFYTEESFDKAKNRKSKKAVNVRGE